LVVNGANAQWVHQNSGTTKYLHSVYFTDANTGFAVGGSCTILKTTNGGTNWAIQYLGTTDNLQSVYFTDADTGYAVGYNGDAGSGTILKTTNGGAEWAIQYSGTTDNLQSVYFTDADTGYAVGFNGNAESGTILKTTNGGAEWTILDSGTSPSFESVYFTNASTGYVLGWDNILKTDDGGSTWTSLSIGADGFELRSVYFINADTGYAVGGNESGSPTYYERYVIIKTTNGGTTWTVNASEWSDSTFLLNSVFFTNANTGYAVGYNGTIMKTTDEGTTWNIIASGTDVPLTSVCFPDANVGYAVGGNGTILKTTNGGTRVVDLSFTSNTLNIYPNPASTTITIETSDISNKNRLSILNLSGQELITRQITEPKTQIDISTLPSGVYFVRLTVEKTVQVGKFIKQ
jgi:photosystem II stability/assembly factor-like uncharacterized protein